MIVFAFGGTMKRHVATFASRSNQFRGSQVV